VEEHGIQYRIIPGKPYYYTKDGMDLFINGLQKDDVVGSMTLKLLTKYKDKPFFFFVHFAQVYHSGHAHGENSKEYNKERLHGKHHFRDLLGRLDEVPESVQQMLSFNRDTLDIFEKTQKRLVKDLQKAPLIQKRVQRLMTIPGVGEILALT